MLVLSTPPVEVIGLNYVCRIKSTKMVKEYIKKLASKSSREHFSYAYTLITDFECLFRAHDRKLLETESKEKNTFKKKKTETKLKKKKNGQI